MGALVVSCIGARGAARWGTPRLAAGSATVAARRRGTVGAKVGGGHRSGAPATTVGAGLAIGGAQAAGRRHEAIKT